VSDKQKLLHPSRDSDCFRECVRVIDLEQNENMSPNKYDHWDMGHGSHNINVLVYQKPTE